MQVDIVPSGSVSLEMMRDLGELQEALGESGIDATGAKAAIAGVKDGGLMVALSVAGLAVSSISSLISALSYWSSKKPAYTLTVEAGPRKLTVSQLGQKGIQAVLKELEPHTASDKLLVRVARS